MPAPQHTPDIDHTRIRGIMSTWQFNRSFAESMEKQRLTFTGSRQGQQRASFARPAAFVAGKKSPLSGKVFGRQRLTPMAGSVCVVGNRTTVSLRLTTQTETERRIEGKQVCVDGGSINGWQSKATRKTASACFVTTATAPAGSGHARTRYSTNARLALSRATGGA